MWQCIYVSEYFQAYGFPWKHMEAHGSLLKLVRPQLNCLFPLSMGSSIWEPTNDDGLKFICILYSPIGAHDIAPCSLTTTYQGISHALIGGKVAYPPFPLPPPWAKIPKPCIPPPFQAFCPQEQTGGDSATCTGFLAGNRGHLKVKNCRP